MIHVNKERLGDFIGSERKNLGLTQRDLAARLHVTDKAVSKWERGLSYPDVTLLEPWRRPGPDGGGADGLPEAGGERSGGAPGSGWRRCWCCWP